MSSSSVFSATACSSRTALVTGGGSGIGLGIARRLAEHGASVVIMGRREDVLKAAYQQVHNAGYKNFAYIVGDVRSEQDAQAAAKLCVTKFGSLDILINCAAGNFLSLAEDLSIKGLKTVLDIDLVGTFNMCKEALPYLKQSKVGGSIVNISATLHYQATWYQTHACAAKSAIDSLTRQLALEWGTFGIRVNGVAPGPIDNTPGLAKLAGTVNNEVKDRVPVGRMGTVQDIGNSCVFLCSEAAGFISGHTIVVDGASCLWTPPTAPRDQVAALSRKVESSSRAVGTAKL